MRYLFCDSCNTGQSGYGFVAHVTGRDPCICPNCDAPGLRPIGYMGLAWKMLQYKLGLIKIRRPKAVPLEEIEFMDLP